MMSHPVFILLSAQIVAPVCLEEGDSFSRYDLFM
jgi:hypothetical protein